ncbi:DNA pilot protein [Sigmofec virus UA08Rod_4301]|uniref:DNA pilot protein n=1 Tax=Sigmofec virus UA08Rod_4301 TaxID=2929398 RepID=A0A976N257_9VIRU|nr:DNA pilot protein [Sigmofec virus UA08Rod_4301]
MIDLINSYSPEYFGAFWQAIGAGISGLFGLGSNLFGASNNRKMQKVAQNFNRSEREASQQYATSERVASQQYATSERKASQAYQDEQRQAQNAWSEQMYNNYSSPQAIAQQYAAAGLNPRLAVDGGSVGSVAASSGSSGSAPSGQSPSGQHTGFQSVTPPYQPVNNLAGGFADIAGALKSFADAKKAGIETERFEKEMDDYLRGIKSNADAQEFYRDYMQPTLNNKEKKLIQQITQEISKGTVELEYMHELLGKAKAERLITEKEAEHWYDKYQIYVNQQQQETEKTRSEVELNKKQKEVLNATVGKIFADTRLSKLNGDVLDETKRYLVSELEKKIENMDADTANKKLQAVYQKLQNHKFKLTGLSGDGNVITGTVSQFTYAIDDILNYVFGE